MLRKIVHLRFFKFLATKYNYLQFPTTTKLRRISPAQGHIRPKGGVRHPLRVAYAETQPGLPCESAHYCHDGSIILDSQIW